jgi:hypothetical protein
MMKIIEILSLDEDTQYFSLNVKNDLNLLKDELKKNTGININEQIWLINGNNINEINFIKETDKICVIVDNKWIKLKIKLINSNIIELPLLSSKINIKDLKLIIFSHINKNLTPDKIQLNYKNNLLDENKKISDYNIFNNSIINVTFKIKSGFIN